MLIVRVLCVPSNKSCGAVKESSLSHCPHCFDMAAPSKKFSNVRGASPLFMVSAHHPSISACRGGLQETQAASSVFMQE